VFYYASHWLFLVCVDNYKKAKPALCFARIAKAILGGFPLGYEHFPIS